MSVDGGGGGIAVRECICVRVCGWRGGGGLRCVSVFVCVCVDGGGGGGGGGLRCVSNFVCVDGGGGIAVRECGWGGGDCGA